MAKHVKQVNNWEIKKYTSSDPYFNPDGRNNYLIKSPNGKVMEDKLTKRQAMRWARMNLDHVQRDTPKPRKKEIDTIHGKGEYEKTLHDDNFNEMLYNYEDGYAVIHEGDWHHIYKLRPYD